VEPQTKNDPLAAVPGGSFEGGETPDLQVVPLEAADGTRTHGLLHGNQKLSFQKIDKSPANRLVPAGR
jgi:hypothetical protein